ncbi:hypothetical protein [Streptomyces chartreusis]|uniref:hypothetical protein n=1 Tax=Streptomyces chartreusis TaxID=1969 RepID=UPI003638EAA3
MTPSREVAPRVRPVSRAWSPDDASRAEHEQVDGALLADQAGHFRGEPGQGKVGESAVRMVRQFHVLDAQFPCVVCRSPGLPRRVDASP